MQGISAASMRARPRPCVWRVAARAAHLVSLPLWQVCDLVPQLQQRQAFHEAHDHQPLAHQARHAAGHHLGPQAGRRAAVVGASALLCLPCSAGKQGGRVAAAPRRSPRATTAAPGVLQWCPSRAPPCQEGRRAHTHAGVSALPWGRVQLATGPGSTDLVCVPAARTPQPMRHCHARPHLIKSSTPCCSRNAQRHNAQRHHAHAAPQCAAAAARTS